MKRSALRSFFEPPEPDESQPGTSQPRQPQQPQLINTRPDRPPAAAPSRQQRFEWMSEPTRADYEDVTRLHPEAERNPLDGQQSISQPGQAADEEADTTLADASEVTAPVTLRNFVRQIIEDADYVPFEGNTDEIRRLNDEQFQTASERREANIARERSLMRQGALQQSIMAVADLFVMNRKQNSPVAVGNRHGLKLSEEAGRRLEAEQILFEKDIEAHYNRLFQQAQREQAVDDQNTQLANQITREDLINRHREELEALRETHQNEITNGAQRFHLEAALRSITAGAVEDAHEHMRLAGIDWNPDTGMIRGMNTQEAPQLSPQEQRQLRVLRDRHERVMSEIQQVQESINAAGAAFGPDHPERKRLEALLESRSALEGNELLAGYLLDKEFEALDQRDRRQALPQARESVLSSTFETDDDQLAAIGGYIEQMREAGIPENIIMQEAQQVHQIIVNRERGRQIGAAMNEFVEAVRSVSFDETKGQTRSVQLSEAIGQMIAETMSRLRDAGLTQEQARSIVENSIEHLHPGILDE